jgi:hypothetical protein
MSRTIFGVVSITVSADTFESEHDRALVDDLCARLQAIIDDPKYQVIYLTGSVNNNRDED